ncbi:tRNA (adenosine(37)-N6)-dimethylallyltransferase MiaA [Aliikangiella marina]|uniref:tRNA dimethylallyltransferase n=1 Tax=Aliikangiella marina TaxID=1712262 RepID=A0A545T7L0_9GAMM|nr:tRNA (adenosine(37)-N6)-dimethylallyltransferase MiaA [Aliikangiella marina]
MFLMGPTASGKTAMAIELYQTGLVEIVSVDSAMVYQQMDIGSAKPTDKELVLAPHHLIDFLDPKESYSASQFSSDAIDLINAIHERGKVPLLVGGTMLYFKALKDGLADLPTSNSELREQLKTQLESEGVEALHEALSKVDKVTANRLHKTDTQRILRALEVYQLSGKPLSEFHQEQQLTALPNPLLSVALAPADRSVLHARIAKRFENMLEAGFVDEVKGLYSRGDLNLDYPSMKCVGYRQVWQYFDGELTIDEAVERAIIATRQLAKRQFTWLRSWPDLHWFDPLEPNQYQLGLNLITDFIQSHQQTIH